MAEKIEKSIEVNVPVEVAYDHWTRFEEFPRFMEGVERVDRVSDRMTHWKVKIAGHEREYDAEITEMEPDRVVAWRASTPPYNAGRVTFEPVSPATTRVTLDMEYEPESLTERVGDMLGLADRRVGNDLENFRKFVESPDREEWKQEAA